MPGNRVTLLHDGDEVYPAMLEAIRSAERFIGLASYIFEVAGPGREIVDALTEASKRGRRGTGVSWTPRENATRPNA